MASSGLSSNLSEVKQDLSRLLQLAGYLVCRESLALLADHFISTNKYEDLRDFISKLDNTITFKTDAGTSIISPDLAHLVIQLLCNPGKEPGNVNPPSEDARDQSQVPVNLTVKIKNVEFEHVSACLSTLISSSAPDQHTQAISKYRRAHINDFRIHYNYLFKRLNAMPVFKGDFQITSLETLTASRQPSIRCICFGLLLKDVSKIDGYLLIDSNNRVPLRIKPETVYRNRLAYSKCIVLVEGVYVNPDDVLYAANIGLPPILLDPIENKSLACVDDKMIVMLKEPFLDDEDVIKSLDMLFSGYNSMEDPPVLFILVGNFTREPCDSSTMRFHTKKLIRILRTCENLKNSHFIFVPGQNDTVPVFHKDEYNMSVLNSISNIMPKPPMTQEQLKVGYLKVSNFNNIHLATNPVHVDLNGRLISIVSHSYIKELHKNLLYDMSDHREDLFEAMKQIILSNGHLSAGISNSYEIPMNLWHRPDLLVLADSGAFGNRYDYSSSKVDDTSFTTLPSFARQSNQFKVYYIKSGEIEDSQVSAEAYQEVEDAGEVETADDSVEGVVVLE